MNGKSHYRKRTDELYGMFRKIQEKKNQDYLKGLEEKEKNELSYCTFTPKILEYNQEMFKEKYKYSPVSILSNYNYVVKMKKNREEKIKRELELSNKLEKNNKITIPQEFNLHNSKINKNYSTHLINKNKFQKSQSNINLNVIIFYFILFFYYYRNYANIIKQMKLY